MSASFQASAQYNNTMMYNSYFKGISSFDQPSELGTDIKRFAVTLPSFQGYAGNTAFSAQDFYNYYQIGTAETWNGDSLSSLDKAAYILGSAAGNTRDRNYVYGGLNAYPLMVSLKVNKKGKELATFSLSSRVIGGANFFYGGRPIDFFWQGNGAWSGEDVNIGNLGINAHAYYELGFAAAVPLVNVGELVDLRLGFRVKQLVGLSAIQTERSDILMYTDPEGKELNFDFDYKINMVIPDEDNPLSFGNNNGRGIGIDAGVSGTILERFKASLALNDIGGIRYSSDQVSNLTLDKTYDWRGLYIKFDSLENAFDMEPDSFLNEFEFSETGESFRMPLATRLVFNASAGIGSMEKKGMQFHRHNFYLTYIQGFTNVPGNSTLPFINGAYAFNLANVLTVGSNFGYGGLYGANLGAFVSANLAVVRLGLGTNSLLGLVVPSASRGVDFSFNMAIAF